jgi:hypothetical protein
MSDIGILELAVLLLLPVLVVVGGYTLLTRALRSEGVDAHVARGRRHQVLVSMLAVVAAIVAVPVAWVLGGLLGQGAVLPLVPSLVVAAACAVLWVGEVTFPRDSGPVRSTVLNDRTLATVLPRGWIVTCAVLAAVLLAVFIAGAVTADDGDQLRWADANTAGTHSPYPGLTYVVPQAVALLLATGLAWLVCRSVTTRPTIASDLAGDVVLRRASAGRVLRWLAWGLAATAYGDLFILGIAVQEVPGWHALGVVAVVVSLALGLIALALPFVPVARLAASGTNLAVGAR